jgi:signal transduction histidine kinase
MQVMENAVSSLAGAHRIQTTPENSQENTGATVHSTPSRPVRGRATYRTWPVFSFALLALLGLMLIPAVTALRRSEAIYDEIRTNQEQFQTTQRVFEALSQNVFSISLTIREFLLDSSPEAGRTYRSRLDGARDQLKADIARLGQVLPPDANVVLRDLKQEVDDYLAAVIPVFDWTAEERAARGVYFLREEQRPRRETILAAADQLSELNASLYAAQQRRTTESEQWFRSELTKSVLFAFLAGVVVSTGGIRRMRSLERKAAAARECAEQTTEEIRQLSVRLRQAQEEERRTISRELHDDVGQQLTAMRMELGTLERLRADGHEFEARLAELKGMAEQSLHVVRDIAAGLRPSVLDDLGLPAAVQKQAREFSKRTGVVVTVSVDGSFERLRDPHRTYIYRIVQEALTNCAKHSDAQSISVTLIARPDRIELTVADDGVGFDASRLRTGGLGLIGMEERVRELGGVADIRSGPGQGTAIHVSTPL